MLARVAEHLYWLSRYVERAEATARLAIAASDTILDLPDGVPYDWESLMQVFGSGDSDPDMSEAEVMEQLVLGLDPRDRFGPRSLLQEKTPASLVI